MNTALGDLYTEHHAEKRGIGFTLLGDVRGAFLAKAIGKGKRVLDIGCRDGALTRYFTQDNEITGVDIDPEALKRAQDSLGIVTDLVDLNGPWPFPGESVDAVVAAEVLEHLYYADRVAQKAAGVLARGGVFVGSIPNAFSLVNRLRYLRKRKRGTPMEDPTHINHFTVAELQRILVGAGFEDVRVTGYGRLEALARLFPQTFAFGLLFVARKP